MKLFQSCANHSFLIITHTKLIICCLENRTCRYDHVFAILLVLLVLVFNSVASLHLNILIKFLLFFSYGNYACNYVHCVMFYEKEKFFIFLTFLIFSIKSPLIVIKCKKKFPLSLLMTSFHLAKFSRIKLLSVS